MAAAAVAAADRRGRRNFQQTVKKSQELAQRRGCACCMSCATRARQAIASQVQLQLQLELKSSTKFDGCQSAGLQVVGQEQRKKATNSSGIARRRCQLQAERGGGGGGAQANEQTSRRKAERRIHALCTLCVLWLIVKVAAGVGAPSQKWSSKVTRLDLALQGRLQRIQIGPQTATLSGRD